MSTGDDKYTRLTLDQQAALEKIKQENSVVAMEIGIRAMVECKYLQQLVESITDKKLKASAKAK